MAPSGLFDLFRRAAQFRVEGDAVADDDVPFVEAPHGGPHGVRRYHPPSGRAAQARFFGRAQRPGHAGKEQNVQQAVGEKAEGFQVSVDGQDDLVGFDPALGCVEDKRGSGVDSNNRRILEQ